MSAHAQVAVTAEKSSLTGRLFLWLSGLACFGLLGYTLLSIGYQIVVPPAASRLTLVQDIPLPSGLGPGNPRNPLAPGIEPMFDGFDFQAYDAPTHHLFIAHTGPSPDLLDQAHIPYDPHYLGHVIVFDTEQDKIVARLPLTQIAGIIDAPDLHKIYAAGVDPGNDQDSIFDVDTRTLRFRISHLTENESPDAITYDPVDHH